VISEQRLAGFSDVVVERDVPAEMRDSTILRANVYRPSSGVPFSVIHMRLPYDKAQAQNNRSGISLPVVPG